ncbi:MAG TPA: hypothetical protein VMJ52_03115 [Xanthobacteraceae bacterium]|nr:hypothetical protein [Xanthobacteraceae bacterium]
MQHRSLGPEQNEIGAGSQSARRSVHDVLVPDVAVGEYDLIHSLRPAQRFKLRLSYDGNAMRIERARKSGRISPAADARYLRGGKCQNFNCRIVAIDDIEVVKIAAGRTHDDDPTAGRHGCV